MILPVESGLVQKKKKKKGVLLEISSSAVTGHQPTPLPLELIAAARGSEAHLKAHTALARSFLRSPAKHLRGGLPAHPPPVSEEAADADDDAMKSRKPWLAEGLVADSGPLPL